MPAPEEDESDSGATSEAQGDGDGAGPSEPADAGTGPGKRKRSIVSALARQASRAAGLVRRPYTWMVDHWPGHNYEDDPEGEPAGAGPEDLGPEELGSDERDPKQEPQPERALEPVAAMNDAEVDDRAVHGPPAPVLVPDDEGPRRRRARRLVPRRVPAFGFRQLAGVGRAVYSTLADPVIGADEETRARRAGRMRKAGMVAASGAMVGVLLYAIFPIRTFLDQWEAMRRAEERIDVFEREAQEAEDEIERLRDPEEVERIAREDYGLVEADEESVSLLPAPDDGPDSESEAGTSADSGG